MSFGQSFQITPVELATTVSSIINGGRRVTPHFGVKVQTPDGENVEILQYDQVDGIVSEETSKTMRTLLEKVVSEGSGKMRRSRATRSAERQPHRRPCQEARTNTFRRFWDLRRRRSRRCYVWSLSMIRRAFIMGVRSRLRCAKKSLKIFCPIWKLKKQNHLHNNIK